MNRIGFRSSPRIYPIPDFRVSRERELSDTVQTFIPYFYLHFSSSSGPFFPFNREFTLAVRFEEIEKTLSFEARFFFEASNESSEEELGETFRLIAGNVYDERYSILVTLVTLKIVFYR